VTYNNARHLIFLSVMTGPIFSLRLFGFFCPCCEKEEDKSARHSVQQLNTLGVRVDWHMGSNKSSTPSGFVQNLFKRQHTDSKPPTPSQMRVVDATKDSINYGAPYPELQIKPLPKLEGSGDPEEKKGLGGLLKRNNLDFQVDIPFHHIERVESIDPTMLVIVTKDIHSTDDKKSTKEAARISFRSADDRNAVWLDLKVLVEWNKNRQPDIEEDLPADGIKARAKKAAHFATRELEMRETRRSREQRKAKYMEGTSGLKYTAMAMANQASS
jgi:hypothetical protein